MNNQHSAEAQDTRAGAKQTKRQQQQSQRDSKDWYEYRSPFMLLFIVLLISALSQFPAWHESLHYVRGELFTQPWRALTHAFVHINHYQLALNIAMLAIMYLLFTNAFISLWWSAALCVSAVSAAIGIYFYSPGLEWTAGMGAALHGLFIYTALRSRANLLWLALPAGKLLVEQYGLPGGLQQRLLDSLPDSYQFFSTTALLDNPSAVDANLWAAMGGLFFYFLVRGAATMLVFITIAREE